jgi:hypothetical protein
MARMGEVNTDTVLVENGHGKGPIGSGLNLFIILPCDWFPGYGDEA